MRRSLGFAGLFLMAGACGSEPPLSMDGGSDAASDRCRIADECGQIENLGCVDGLCAPVMEPTQWSCIQTAPMQPEPVPGATHLVRTRVTDSSSTSLPGVTVRFCSDIECNELISGPFQTDDTGKVFSDVPSGFHGLILHEYEGLIPIAIAAGPVTEDTTYSFTMFSVEDVNTLITSFGLRALDLETEAAIFVDVDNCADHGSSEGAYFRFEHQALSNDPTLPIYTAGAFPVLEATATTASGRALFPYIAPGDHRLVARSHVSGRLIGVQKAPARAGWGTLVQMDPRANR